METLVQIILPSVVLPIILTVITWNVIQSYPTIQWCLPLIWLPSYFWLTGVLTIPPAEAQDWLWILLGLTILPGVFIKSRLLILTLLQTLLLALSLIAISWPVLQYQLSFLLISELITVIIIAYIIFKYIIKENTVATISIRSSLLSMALSSAGLSIIITLTGSLLIGQLAGILAVILFVLVALEFLSRFRRSTTIPITLVPFIQLYIAILVIARIYVELPFEIVLLLLAAPLINLIPILRYGYSVSFLSIVIAICWTVFTADSSSYY